MNRCKGFYFHHHTWLKYILSPQLFFLFLCNEKGMLQLLGMNVNVFGFIYLFHTKVKSHMTEWTIFTDSLTGCYASWTDG